MSTHAFAPTFKPFDFLSHDVDLTEGHAAEATEPSYVLVQSGPPVPADEVESHVDAVEITARWGAQVLTVAHLDEGKSFFVGEGTSVALSEDVLGAARAAIVEGGYVHVPARARATIETRGASSESVAGPAEIALTPASKVTLEIDAITFEIATVRKGKVAPVGFLSRLAGRATGFVGLSFLAHAAIVASMATFMPKLGADDAEAMDRDQLLLMQKFLNAAAEHDQDPPKDPPTSGDQPAGGSSTGGEPHKGEAGVAGTTRPVTTSGHMAFKGDDRESAVPSRDEVAEFGLLGILRGGAARDPNAPASPWSTETYKGSDERSAMGALFGPSIDDAAGMGLGLWGTGEGGGGKGAGVGIDGVGSTVGGGGGGPGKWGYGTCATPPCEGLGIGHGPGKGAHIPKALTVRNPTIESNGRLPAEVIQRIVRQNFGRFRLCYEGGLRQNPGLSGRVVAKFVIDRNGAVANVSDGGSDLPDQAVTQCIVRSFANLSFPMPDGGIATVSYPIILTPGE